MQNVENIDVSPTFGNTVLGAVPSVVYNEDCVEGLKRFSDNYFDLAIVDPPYGISWSKSPVSTSGIRTHSKNGKKSFVKGISYVSKDWDENYPTQSYFDELFRVSKNQIIWGENYIQFEQKNKSTGRIFWDKVNDDTTFSDGELAWCSMINTIRQIEYMWKGMMQGKSIFDGRVQQANKQLNEKKIHPTQKPVKLYEWILHEFTKEGDLILDTHVGSGSSRIACHKAGLQFTGFEIDKDYYDAQEKRFKDFVSQLRMF